MDDTLRDYINSELTFIYQEGEEYRKKHSKIADRLRLRREDCEDPHTALLIDAFAILCARIRYKLDDEFPEITEALLESLYPHYLRPIPSMALAQFDLDPSQSKITGGTEVPSGTPVYSQPENGMVASFRTCYPVTLWPIDVSGARLLAASNLGSDAPSGAVHAIRVTLNCRGGLRFDQLPLASLRFYLNGKESHVHTLYELLFTQAMGVLIRDAGGGAKPATAWLSTEAIRPVGFSRTEGLLPYTDRSFLGYRLIQEYFYFPQKFLFFDVAGLEVFREKRFGSSVEMTFVFGEPELKHRMNLLGQAMGASTFQLGCAPIVNLFTRTAEPIRLTHETSEYRVVADQHRQGSTEVYSVDNVDATSLSQQQARAYMPLYSSRYTDPTEGAGRFWLARRRPSKSYGGSDVYLSLVDPKLDPNLPPNERLTLTVTCTNRDFAEQLQWRESYGELQPEGLPLVRARCLAGATPAVRPPLGGALQWRLISHLSPNHLSVADRGVEALRDILRLYDLGSRPEITKQIDSIVGVASKPSVSPLISPSGLAFCRGLDVTIDFDEGQLDGTFLFAAVLERFLVLYSAINSYSRLIARSRQRTRNEGVLKKWSPRMGEQATL